MSIDRKALNDAWLEVQRRRHPDRLINPVPVNGDHGAGDNGATVELHSRGNGNLATVGAPDPHGTEGGA